MLAHVGWPTVGLAIVILIGRAIRDKDQTRRLIGLIVVLVAVVVGSVAICVELLGMQVPGFHVAAMTRAAAPVATASPRPAPPVAADPVATASPSGHCHALPDLAQPSAHPPSPAAPAPGEITGAARPDVRECTLDSAAHVKPEPATGAARPWPSVESRRCTPTVLAAGRRPLTCIAAVTQVVPWWPHLRFAGVLHYAPLP